MKQQITAWLVLSALFATTACAPRKTVKSPESQPSAAAGAGAGAAQQTSPNEAAEANLRGSEFVAAPDLEIAHFDYDSYSLSDAVRDILKKNAEFLKSNGDLEVLATGNCDERGTIAYNLALGQKRAQAVREYYIRLGVAGKNIATISYGKEKPICSESNEQCWAQNRRAETLVRAHGVQKASKTQ